MQGCPPMPIAAALPKVVHNNMQPVMRVSFGRPRGLGQQQRGHCIVAAAAGRQQQQPQDPYVLLQIPRGSSRRQIRAAYIDRMKLLHPDVSASGEKTTLEAAAVNAAYEQVMSGFDSNSRGDSSDEEEDPFGVFDLPEAEPDQLFVNPFACYNISPLQWEQLQAAAKEAEAAGRDPWYALQEQGVQCSEAAFIYLSPQQLALVTEELERACMALDATSMEIAAFFLSSCLMRARMANNRMPSRSRA